MANEQKPGNLPNNSIILAAVVATGTLVYFHEAPLEGSRPAIKEPAFHQAVSDQDIEARLWQDPFAPVAESVDKFEEKRRTGATLPPDHLRSPMQDVNENTLVLGVTVSGSPYSEDGEFRRRLRYAVLSGLDRAGFVPKGEHHLGYFRPPLSVDSDLKLPKEIPYEWFKPASSSKKQLSRVLVLWLNEDVLAGAPLQKLSWLVRVLRQGVEKKVTIRILGPQSSDTLVEMAKDAPEGEKLIGPCVQANPDCRTKKWPSLSGIKLYPYGATIANRELFKVVSEKGTPPCSVNIDTPPSSVDDYFARHCITLHRTIATDEVLARATVDELKLRGVEPGWKQRAYASANKSLLDSIRGEHHLALITEWDTFYGQTLPETMERCFAAGDPPKGETSCPSHDSLHRPWVHLLKYLRGLDGALPSVEATGDWTTDKKAERTGVKDNTKDPNKTQTDDKAFDRPYGQGQQDYLRRIANHLRALDEKLRRDNEGSIKAIGVLGSDVFDKLLVLRALKTEFPEALFFTTDFDYTLTIQRELEWTRNLIIASSFGPELTEEIQREIPPFRNSYQTSAFLATQLAIADAGHKWENEKEQNKADKEEQNQIANWLKPARIFEVERTGGIFPYPGGNRYDCPDGNLESEKCSSIQPHEEYLYPNLKRAGSLLLGLAVCPPSLLRQQADREWH